MKYYYVYIHICLVSAKAYVGWSANPKRRWVQHCAAKDNRPFYNAIQKYGKECFESQIIFRTTNLEEVKQKEIEFIKQFDTLIPNGYNLTRGGDSGPDIRGDKNPMKRPEVAAKISKALRGKNKSEEHKKNIGKAKKGKKHSVESNKKKGHPGNKYRQGQHPTKETKEKLRKALQGNKRAKGHKHSEESKKKMSHPGNQFAKGHRQSKKSRIKKNITQLKNSIKELEQELEKE